MKRNAVLTGLLLALAILPGKSIGQTLSEDGRLVYNYPFAPSEGLVNRLEKEYRQEICLNGYWEFQPMALPSSYKQGKGIAPELPLPQDGKWSDVRIKIPSPWNINAFANRGLEGPDHRNYPSYPREWEQVKMGWLKKTATIPADWDGQQIKLYFEAVAGAAVVYVNQEKVGENFDLFLPFSIDITDKVKAGDKVEIMVGVRSQSLFEDNSTVGRRIVPAGSMWGYHVAGIWQDVYLLALPQVQVENVYVKPLVSQNMLEFDVTVRNNTDKKANVQLQGRINEWVNLAGTDVNSAPVPAWELGKEALTVEPVKATVPANSFQKVTLQVPVADGDLRYWTPEHPNLYAALLSLKSGKLRSAIPSTSNCPRSSPNNTTSPVTS